MGPIKAVETAGEAVKDVAVGTVRLVKSTVEDPVEAVSELPEAAIGVVEKGVETVEDVIDEIFDW